MGARRTTLAINKNKFYAITTVLAAFFIVGAYLLFAVGLVKATSFTEGYQSVSPVSVGTVVSLANNSTSQVENTTADNDTRVIGVVADASSSIIDLQPKNANIRVAISGQSQILVTDIDGDIKSGDQLIISPLSGVAMKDKSEQTASKYLGVAKDAFSSKSTGAKQVSVTLNDGSKKTFAVGLIAGNILISERQNQKVTPKKSILSSIGERLVGKPVSSIRVILAGVILILAFLLTVFMLGSSIRGSFVSLGRNPLARSSIITGLMKVILVALLIFGSSLVASYLVMAF